MPLRIASDSGDRVVGLRTAALSSRRTYYGNKSKTVMGTNPTHRYLLSFSANPLETDLKSIIQTNLLTGGRDREEAAAPPPSSMRLRMIRTDFKAVCGHNLDKLLFWNRNRKRIQFRD